MHFSSHFLSPLFFFTGELTLPIKSPFFNSCQYIRELSQRVERIYFAYCRLLTSFACQI